MSAAQSGIIRHVESLFAPAKADALAAQLTADDDEGWTYRAAHDPQGTGLSFITIYDDAGEFVGKL